MSLLALLGLSCASPPSPSVGADLLGTWSATIEHAGQKGDLVVRFELGEDGDLRASLSLPTIDAWNAATLPVTIDGDRLDLGLFALRREDDGLAGELPPALVPVHQIAFTLQRLEQPTLPPAPPAKAPTVEPLWVRDLGSPIWAGATAADGVLYIGADDGGLYALAPATGSILWRVETGGAIRARPTLEEGVLYVPSDDGLLYALDAGDGRPIWKVRLQHEEVGRIAPGRADSRYDHYASSATRYGGSMFVASHEGTLFALDAASGAERWRFASGDIVTSTPAVEMGHVVFGSFDGHVYAVDAASGSERWRFDTGAAVSSSPAVGAGLVVVGSRSYDLFALRLESGRPAWRHYIWYSWVESSPRVDRGTVFVGSSDAQVVSKLSLETGELHWRFDTGGSAWGQPAITDDTVYAGSVGVADYMVDHRGGLFAFDRVTGKARWAFLVERPDGAAVWGFAASPAVDGRRMYVGGLDGRVYAFPLSSSRPIDEVPVNPRGEPGTP